MSRLNRSQVQELKTLIIEAEIVDAAGTTVYSYWLGGALKTEGGLWANDTVTWNYHPLVSGLRTNLTVAQPSGSWSVTNIYDATHRLATVTSPAGQFGYYYTNAAGQSGGAYRTVAGLSLPSGARITNTYDGLARLLSTTLLDSSQSTINSHSYQLNDANQRTRQTRTDTSYVDYGYDSVSQLKTAVGSGGQSTESLGYLYDAGWNLNKRTNNGVTMTFTVNNLNQVTSDGTNTYTYDWNGNLVSKTWSSGSLNFTYDDENQLTRVATDTYYTPTGSRWRSDFVYDARMRLRKRLDYTWNPYTGNWGLSSETRYVYDGMLVVQERNSSNTPTVGYTRGLDLSGTLQGAGGIGGMLGRSTLNSQPSTHAFYHADGNGNITCLITNQTVVASYRYDPYGRSLYSSGSLAGANVYRFSSKPLHANSGLYYYGYRFYWPELQRWMNRDPIEEEGGINLYGYIGNDPLDHLDKRGLQAHVLHLVFPEQFGGVLPIVCRLVAVQWYSFDIDQATNSRKACEYVCIGGTESDEGQPGPRDVSVTVCFDQHCPRGDDVAKRGEASPYYYPYLYMSEVNVAVSHWLANRDWRQQWHPPRQVPF